MGAFARTNQFPIRIRIEELLETRYVAPSRLFSRLSLTADIVVAGSFGYSYPTGEIIANPWASSENPHVAPFDQDFYLREFLLFTKDRLVRD